MKKVTFSTNCTTSNLKRIRTYVSEQLKHHSISDQDANLVILAVDEVCANIIIHSNGCNEQMVIELNLLRINGDLIVEIYDNGKAFDPKTYHEPKLQEIVREGKRGGIGMMIVRRIMDKIEYSTAQEKNVCRLTKQIRELAH